MSSQPLKPLSSSCDHGLLIAQQNQHLQEISSTLQALTLQFDPVVDRNQVLQARIDSMDAARERYMVDNVRQEAITRVLIQELQDTRGRETALHLKIRDLEDKARGAKQIIDELVGKHSVFIATVKQNWGKGAIMTFYPPSTSLDV
ncbi:hypothetical protein FA13DRAFT_1707158 [Coprinellus micaceus]|uniref:Uncharacterized protein n=1 Tax=Coprinellus micaceus TaxID=71717 RepID=A0A4Y7TN37_COPMI|nr:hypothetical protein FA13DRAFT_1707158 [Coprinellus micaceus]